MQPKDNTRAQPLVRVQEMYSTEDLLALCQRIISSGILGRSKYYSALLEYLVRCSLSGKTPKEIELAVDVLNRDDGFDVSADSMVRVYIHQLRKKLDKYYENYEHDAACRIVIPKGQYTIAAQEKISSPVIEISQNRQKFNNGLLLVGITLLAVNLIYMTMLNRDNGPEISQDAAQHPIG